MSVLRRYIFWTYERGSFHYDVMVTLILLFLFVSPHFINFHDRPVPEIPQHASEVLVREQGSSGTDARFVFEIRIDDLHGATTAADIRTAILNVIEPISGGVTLVGEPTPVTDAHGKVVAYDATVLR